MIQLNYFSILPEMVIALTGLLVLVVDAARGEKDGHLNEIIVVSGLLLALFLAFKQLNNPEQITTLYMLISDRYAIYFKIILIFLSIMIILISSRHLRDQGISHRSEYYSLISMATLGMIIMSDSLDLVTIYIGLELMAISIYILVAIFKKELLSNEAALKYFLLGLLASCFLLYGISLVYGFFGTTNLVEIKIFLDNNGLQNNPGIILALIFLAIAFGFKIAAVPFHMWTPDVYEGAFTPITAFMSIGPKIAAFAVLGRIFAGSFFLFRTEWIILFYILSVLTMTFGNVVAIAQTNIKRMLAYSSIAHAGYCLIGVVASGTKAGDLGMQALLFYLSGYLFMNLAAFSIIIFMNKKGVTGAELDDFSGLNERAPGMALIMAISLFSLAGIPPTVGFVGKFYIFMAAVKAEYIWLAIIGVLNSVISLYYYLRVIVYMYMKAPIQEEEVNRSKALFFVLGISVVAIIALGIYPKPILEFALKAVGGMI